MLSMGFLTIFLGFRLCFCIEMIIMVRNYFLRKGNAMDSNVFDVIIVGAGLAGLSAAVTFIDANITNILILEGWFQLGFF